MTKDKTLVLVRAGLMAALCCIATMVIKIPTPGTGGYIHLGDAFVVLSGIILGPVYGALAAGIGSALADLFSGYVAYAPITMLIKGIIAFVVGLIYHRLKDKISNDLIRCILGGLFATAFVAAGYLAYEILIYGKGAILSVPANLIQGASGLIISSVLLPTMKRFIVEE